MINHYVEYDFPLEKGGSSSPLPNIYSTLKIFPCAIIYLDKRVFNGTQKLQTS